MAQHFHAATIECKALDLASDLVKQGRISRAEAQVIRDLAEVAAKRLSPAERASLENMITTLADVNDRVSGSIAIVGAGERTI